MISSINLKVLSVILVIVYIFYPVGKSFAVTINSIEIISKSTSSIAGDDFSANPSVSDDGRYVAFYSGASNLVDGDTNLAYDIFLRDTQENTTTRISVSTAGVGGNSTSYDPKISYNGRYVVFRSDSNNLVAGDTNAASDVFLRDTQTNTTTRVSVSTAGVEGNSYSEKAGISNDGRYVAFYSGATNLVAGDTNAVADIFLRDTQENTTTRISVSTAGIESNGASNDPKISSDGRYVAFFSTATNLVAGDTNGSGDMFIRDTQENTTTRVTLGTAGVEGDDESDHPNMSSNGRYAVFQGLSSNLVTGDTNAVSDIFLRDTQENTTVRVSVSTAGAESDGPSGYPSVSSDGRYVLFYSEATNLVPGDTNAVEDVFLRDTQENTTIRVSVSEEGIEANDYSYQSSISSNGLYIAFSSSATNLIAGDTNAAEDVFLLSLSSVTTPTITTSSATSISTTTATLNGEITATGGESNTVRGFDIGTDISYTMTDITESGSYSTGVYSLSATGLTCDTAYHYRSYSINSAGTSTGSDSQFTTSSCPNSSGSSAGSRAYNLFAMGKTQEAKNVIAQYPNALNEIKDEDIKKELTTNSPSSNPSSTITFTKIIRKGIVNPTNTVKILQKIVGVNQDGKFGPKTEKAVKEFQTKHNLVSDGIVGPKTIKVINSI